MTAHSLTLFLLTLAVAKVSSFGNIPQPFLRLGTHGPFRISILKDAANFLNGGDDEVDEECPYDNPYSELQEMHDECLASMHQIPTVSAPESELDHIVQCAQDGDCSVEELYDMIEELDQLNLECEGHVSRECSLDAREARNLLKVALGSQASMARKHDAHAPNN